MTNAIRTQINLLRNTKTNIRTAIMEKGVTVSGSDPFSVYPTRISQISATPGTCSDDLKKLLDGSLTSYSIPDGTERIRYSGFEGYTSLTSVTIPASVTYIGERAFGGCTSLQSITCKSATPPTLPYTMSTTGAFYNTNNCPIYVPAASVDAYKTAWSHYASRIQGFNTDPDWVEVRYTCEFDATWHDLTGNVIVTEEDMNQYSATYGQTRTRTYADASRCGTNLRFRKVTQLSDATSGKYLIVNEQGEWALNASLIKTTTSNSNGINQSSSVQNKKNVIPIYIRLGGDYIQDVNEENYYAAVDYDATNKTLSWTDPDTGTKYMIDWAGSSNTYFRYTNLTNGVSNYQNVAKTGTAGGNIYMTFGNSTRLLGFSSPSIRWYQTSNTSYLQNIALYKLS